VIYRRDVTRTIRTLASTGGLLFPRGKHVGCGSGVEGSVAEKPAHESRADALGEHREVIRRNGPGRQELGALGVGVRPEQAVGRARMEVDVAVESGTEAVEEGDGAEPRAEGRAGGGVRHGHRSAEPPLDLVEEEKHATEAGAGRFEKPAPDARAAPPESLIGRKTVEKVPLTGLSFDARDTSSSTAG
jgi:hypothetical protein